MLSHPALFSSKKSQRFLLLPLMISLIALAVPSLAQATFTILGPFPIITTTYGVGTVALVPPTSNSPGTWSFASSNLSAAVISGNTINVVGTGTSTITATQAASGAFDSRSRSTQIRISRGTPTLGAFPSQSIPIQQRIFLLTPPTSTSDGNWSYASLNSNIASVVGNRVALLSGGTVTITATQNNTVNWNSASASMRFTVVVIAPVIGSFGDISIMKDSVASLNLVAPTSTSLGFWTFTSSNPAVATVASNVVTPVSYGTTTITATQTAVGDYGSATASMTLTVQGPMPTVGTFPGINAQLPAVTSVALQSPTSTSTGAWTFTSSDPSVASINGSVATLLKPGTTTITASQASTATFASPTPLTMILSVSQTPVIGSWAEIEKVVQDPDFTLVPPTSTSSGAWTFTSSDPTIVNVVGGVVKVVGAGKATITATQAATPIWAQASAQMSIRVFGAIPALGTFAPIVGGVGDGPIAITPPSSNSQGVWTYTSSNAAVAVINGTSLSIVGVGTATITAMQKPAGIYSQSNTVQTTVTGKPKPVVGNFQNLKVTLGDASPIILLPASSSSGAWSFTSSKPAVATINNAIIQLQGVGVSTITATQAATGDFAAISKTFTIDVLSKPVVKPTPKPTSTPVAKPTPKPTSTPVQKPSLKVSVAKRVITVSVIGAKATVTISGIKAKIGKNAVKAGKHSVVITIDKKVIYRRIFTIK